MMRGKKKINKNVEKKKSRFPRTINFNFQMMAANHAPSNTAGLPLL